MKKSSAQKAIDTILSAFENGNIPQAIAFSTFDPPENIPAYKWSWRNRAIAFLQGTGDARGFRQWSEAGRKVKRGSKAIHILGPKLVKKDNEESDINVVNDNDEVKCIGYYTIPVFRMEDTEGEPLEYASLDVKSLPLADIARKWGLTVKAGSFNGEYYAYYSDYRKEIVMATDNELSFLHELSHAAHYRIDKDAYRCEKWEKELIAELSAAALCHMIGKEPNTGNHFQYIKRYAEEAKLSPVKACMKILDTCMQVIEEIVKETDTISLKEVA